MWVWVCRAHCSVTLGARLGADTQPAVGPSFDLVMQVKCSGLTPSILQKCAISVVNSTRPFLILLAAVKIWIIKPVLSQTAGSKSSNWRLKCFLINCAAPFWNGCFISKKGHLICVFCKSAECHNPRDASTAPWPRTFDISYLRFEILRFTIFVVNTATILPPWCHRGDVVVT